MRLRANGVDKLPDDLKQPLVQLLLSVADDKFMLGHRNADWTGLAPILEEDIAFSSLAQDEIAHASTLYQLIGELIGVKADKLAFGREPAEYRCAEIVELSDEFNWALAIARSFFCDHFDFLRLNRLARSAYTPLAQLAGRLVAEEQIHVEHVDSWIGRLGKGGPEARSRIQQALHELSSQAPMLFEPTEGSARLEAAGIYPTSEPGMFDQWQADLQKVATGAGLVLQLTPPKDQELGGRRGRHSAAFLPLLDELTEVYRLEPEAAW
jgi:ring-1,2-phenylacetyl-CoA epoxidase subunit PaaC